ncbi:MAG: Uma2 family endonuclease [Cyanobacteria bacterium P01_G01_bin.39]
MIADSQNSRLTPEEYLQLEADSDIKHEYIDGKIYAMAGATDTHVTIALNLAILLRSHLRDSDCRVYISDMKVRIETKNRCLDARSLAPDGDAVRQSVAEVPSVVGTVEPVRGSHRFFYPDVMVTCEPQDKETNTYKQFPRLIIEVLSDSTEAFDRGDKFADYQSLSSLQEYVLINTRKARIECFRRTEAGLWLLQFYELKDSQFALTNVDFTGQIAEVYEQVDFISESNSSEQ